VVLAKALGGLVGEDLAVADMDDELEKQLVTAPLRLEVLTIHLRLGVSLSSNTT
jgi:hypothetical protein